MNLEEIVLSIISTLKIFWGTIKLKLMNDTATFLIVSFTYSLMTKGCFFNNMTKLEQMTLLTIFNCQGGFKVLGL